MFRKQNQVHTINDILSLYIFNVILHSQQHMTFLLTQILFGKIHLLDLKNQINIITMILYHDTFAYNLNFWLDKKFEKTIVKFQKDLQGVDSYTKKCGLNQIYGLEMLASAINN